MGVSGMDGSVELCEQCMLLCEVMTWGPDSVEPYQQTAGLCQQSHHDSHIYCITSRFMYTTYSCSHSHVNFRQMYRGMVCGWSGVQMGWLYGMVRLS